MIVGDFNCPLVYSVYKYSTMPIYDLNNKKIKLKRIPGTETFQFQR